MTALLALLLVLVSAPFAVAQSPSESPANGAAWPAGPVLGGTVASDEGRDADGDPVLRLGTGLEGLALTGDRGAFTPTETFAWRLELPGEVGDIRVALQLHGTVDGIAATWSYPDAAADAGWDTLAGRLPAPPVGEYRLLAVVGGRRIAETPLAVYDVPRLTALITDPAGLLADSTDQVTAAGQRYEDATGGGWLWTVLIDTTGGIPVSQWAQQLADVNADQIDPRDALLVAAAGDVDVAIIVGSEAARTIVPEEIAAIEDEAVFALGDAQFAEMVDIVADGLVTAHLQGPTASPSPTPRPTATPEPTPLRTPDFIGLTRSEAQALADRRGLDVAFGTRETTEAARGTVIDQDPPAGTSIAPDELITLTVAVPPAGVPVPDVTGLPEADAVAVLLDAGLEPGDRFARFSSTIAEGDVIRTDPRAGVQVAIGTSVDYYVSRGPAPSAAPTPVPTPTPRPTPRPVEVPDVRGLDEADAISALIDSGLQPGDRFERASGRYPAGSVTRTDPPNGTSVPRGTVVDYYISTGPAPTAAPATPSPAPTRIPAPTERPGVVVPDVRGLDEADAVASLLDVGLQPGDRFERASDRFPAGTVTRTDPPNGTTVPRRTVVDYYVSTGPTATQAPVTPPPTVVPTTPGDDQLGRIIAAGVLRVNVDPDDPPWSYAGAGGGRTGFDASVARAIAKRLGVEVEFTTFPLAEVVTGAWKDRFDIAISRLAITADRVGTLAFTRPYAYDPQQLAATVESGLVTIDELAGRAVCAPSLSVGLAWLSGTLALVEPPLEPAPPPPGATAFETADDADCAAIIAATGAPFDAWLASLPSQQLAIANKLPVTPLGNPVVWAPVGVAFDPLVPDGASLIATVDDIVRQLLEDGSLSRLSTRAFAGLDLTVVPKDGVVTAPQPSMTPIPL